MVSVADLETSVPQSCVSMNPSIALAVAVVVDDAEAAAGAGAVESKGGDDGALAAPDTDAEVPDPNYVPEVSIACLLHCRTTLGPMEMRAWCVGFFIIVFRGSKCCTPASARPTRID